MTGAGAPPARHRDIGLRWLIRLRWGAVASEALVVLVAAYGLGIALRTGSLLGLVALIAVSNVALDRAGSIALRDDRLLSALFLFDVAVLTALLYLSGGPTNPFSVLYLVYVTLGAIVLEAAWAAAVVLAAIAGYGALFLGHVEVPALSMHHVPGGVSAHLYGMFVAFAICAVLVAYCVSRLSEALRRRELDLAAAGDRAARARQLAALTTLSAGAAHELETPLGTIAIAAGEMLREAEALGHAAEGWVEDAALIQAEVDRCRAILDHLAAKAGATVGEPVTNAPIEALIAALGERLGPGAWARVRFERPDALTVRLPVAAVSQLLANLVRNALSASAADAAVRVRALPDAASGALRFAVIDHGAGMDAATAERATEPFFTTKRAGEGMGLGLFLARATSEALGGSLSLDTAPGRGTTVQVVLPGACAGTPPTDADAR